MKERMCRQMSDCCCQMMTMTMYGSVYLIGVNEVKKKQNEKNSFSNSNIIEYQHQQHLG